MAFTLTEQVWRATDLTMSEKIVLLRIADRVNPNTGIAWPGVRSLADECGKISKSGVAKIVERLIAKGYLLVVEAHAGKRPRTYRINEDRLARVHSEWTQGPVEKSACVHPEWTQRERAVEKSGRLVSTLKPSSVHSRVDRITKESKVQRSGDQRSGNRKSTRARARKPPVEKSRRAAPSPTRQWSEDEVEAMALWSDEEVKAAGCTRLSAEEAEAMGFTRLKRRA